MGIDWTSQVSLNTQGFAMHKVDLICFGMFLWECVVSLWYDFDVLVGRRPFKWPTLIYWMTKYSTFWFILAVNITNFQVAPIPVNCQAMGDFIDLMARVGMAGASCMFMLRTIALWKRDKRVMYPLLVAHLGQWGLYLHNVFIVKEAWSPDAQTCAIYTVTWPWMKVQFIYTMCFDLIVLVLACWALISVPGPKMNIPGRSLWKLLVLDGISYFLVAFLCYLACVIVAYLNISVVLAFMFSDTATILTTAAACRSFVRIGTWSWSDDETSLPTISQSMRFNNDRPQRRPAAFGTSFATSNGNGSQVDSDANSVQNKVSGISVSRMVDLKLDNASDIEAQSEK